MRVAVLGAGMVGRTIAMDLAQHHEVIVFDVNANNLDKLPKNIARKTTDLSDFNSYSELLSTSNFVVSAVPGFMGYQALDAIITAGKSVADISFFSEDALELNEKAKKNNVTAIVDCGVAPGLSNLILGYYDSILTINSFECYVGGLPKVRLKPFEYKAPFSPVDVIQEYIRPARFVENGTVITKPALSDLEEMDFENAGTLEAFNTDGLRSIIHTMKHIPNLKEKTLRYPGHTDLIIALQKTGFFNNEQIKIKGVEISPFEFTSSLLIDQWKLNDKDEEFTVMKIIIRGAKHGVEQTVTYDLYDEYDTSTHTSSMSRTTGFTCGASLNLIAEELFFEKGVYPLELVGGNKTCFDFMISYLSKRNVNLSVSTTITS